MTAKAKISVFFFGTAVFVIGGLVGAYYVICAGVMLVLAALALFAFPGEGGTWISTQEAEADLDRIAKEAGITPYSKKELAAMEEAERREYNDRIRSIVDHSSPLVRGETYVDYDNNVRSVDDDSVVKYSKKRGSR